VAVFQTFRADGGLQFDAGLMTMTLIGKGTVYTQAPLSGRSVVSSALVPLPNLSDPIIMAIQTPYFAARAGRYMNGSQAVAHYATAGAIGSPLRYWLFGKTNSFPPANVGLELFDQAGNLTYSSSRPICAIASVLNGSGQSATLWGGREFAMSAQEWTGYRSARAGLYRNGVPWEPGDSSTSVATWSYNQETFLYGCAVNGVTVATAGVNYDSGRTTLGSSREPIYPPANATWTRPMGSVLVIDVTGL
jgi:hypothetical protein